MIDLIIKYNVSLTYDEELLNTEFNINDSLDIVLNFFKDYDELMYNSFLNVLNDKKIRFVSHDIYKDEFNGMNSNNGDITIVVTNTLKDIYSIVHEFTHYYSFQKGMKVVNEELLEVVPITMEFKVNDYLIKNNIIDYNNYDFIKNRMFNSGIDALYLLYIYIIKNNPKVMFLRMVNKNLYLSKVNGLLDGLSDDIKRLIFNYQDKFENQIDLNGFYHYDLDYRYRYLNALMYAPYLNKIDDKELLEEIDKGIYDNNYVINIDNDSVFKECDGCFKKIVYGDNIVNLYDLDNIEQIVDKIISIYNENNIEMNLDAVSYENAINIKDSYELVLDFLNYFDPTLKEAFMNIRDFEKGKFIFLNKETEPIDKTYSNEVRYDEDGKTTIVVTNTISDVFAIVHEFIHLSYFDKGIMKTHQKIDNFRNFVELGPFVIEYYLWDYLKNYTYYGRDVDSYMINRNRNSIISCYMAKYRLFYKKLLMKYNDVDKVEEVIDDEINKLPDHLRDNFIKYRSFYYVNVDCAGLSLIECDKRIKYSFRYVYAAFLSPYIYETNDKSLFDYASKLFVKEDSDLVLNNKKIEDSFRNYINLFNSKSLIGKKHL